MRHALCRQEGFVDISPSRRVGAMDIPTTRNLSCSVDQFPILVTLLATSGTECYIMNVCQTQ